MKVSVIIPVYNAEATLIRCLDSLAKQTFRDFEVICVDDGSTDASLTLLKAYTTRSNSEKTFSLKVIHQENSGTYQARKSGVAAARGEYLSFIDPDDWVRPQFLEKLLGAAEDGDWDIVQCGVELEELRERTIQQRAISERYFNPDVPTIREGQILTRVFILKQIGWNLIFRLFKSSVAKDAFAELPNANMINETDVAAFFGIAMRAQSFRRIPNRLYVYQYGDGISTRLNYSLEDFKRVLGKFDFLRGFAPCVKGEESQAAFVVMAQRMCENTRKSAFARIPDGEMRKTALSALHNAVKLPARPIHHIGIHYFNLKLGGVQRVLLQEVETFLSLGIRVTLFLEDEPGKFDFVIPPAASVVRFPRSQGNVLPEEERIPRVATLMRDSGIDCWYDHAVFAPAFLQDVCIAKWLLGLPALVHYHTTFTAPLRFTIHPEYYELQSHWMRLADCVLTLSKVDSAYFRSQAVPAVVLPNAVSQICREALHKPLTIPKEHKILWCGRRSWEKRPADAKKILKEVRKHLSNVTLDFVSGVANPYSHFESASVFLSTSMVEGFPMTSIEALAHGLPIVAYTLNNLDLYRNNSAVFQVPQGDIKAAAEAIVNILTRPDYSCLREMAKQSLREFVEFDHAAFWRKYFAGVELKLPADDSPDILKHVQTLEADGLAYYTAHRSEKRLVEKKTLRECVRYVRNNGLKYTVRHVLSKFLKRI